MTFEARPVVCTPRPSSTVADPSTRADGDNTSHCQTRRSLSPPPQHRRGYQACDACRKRKVKCDQGSVDNPRPPPCVRCRREGKRCEFSATRRKRKVADIYDNDNHVLCRDERMMYGEAISPPASAGSAHTATTSQVKRPVSAWPSTDSTNGDSAAATAASTGSRPSTTAAVAGRLPQAGLIEKSHQYYSGASYGYASQERTSTSIVNPRKSGHVMNKTAADLLSPAISNTHDALHLLSEAAGRSEGLSRNRFASARHPSSSTLASSGSPLISSTTPQQRVRTNSVIMPATQPSGPAGWYRQERESEQRQQTDTSARPETPIKGPEEIEYMKAVRVWSRFRFIRAGWFSVDEAMDYVSYYYQNLAPLSPIVIPDFNPPSTHHKLLTEEPILAVTMLTIASRHMNLSGNGAYTRAYQIHEMLWSYLRRMIERLFWGQERFGNSNPPRGPKGRDASIPIAMGQAKRAGPLRSLGTVEALLLLTDWHPRSLYFPPGDDENALLDADLEMMHEQSEEADTASKSTKANAENRFAFNEWLEPVWRSDRMSWMLLSTAQSLAFELGVFDKKNDLTKSTESPYEQRRKRRVRRLILVYVSQCSGRLGIPSMLPFSEWELDTDPIPPSDDTSEDSDYETAVDQMQECWMDISKINYASNIEIFSSKEYTTNFIRTGRYRDKINEYMPLLRKFKRKIEGMTSLWPQMLNALRMEYEYTRLYINCMALQAVVDKWTTMASQDLNHNANGSKHSSLHVLMEQYRVNEAYIQEVIDASRTILQIVLDKLVPNDYLKHAPIRTFFRILSGMIFILKTFTLGAKEDDVRISLELQDRTIECLRTCVVDDVHLSVTIASLVEVLTTSIRTKFLRFAPFERSTGENSLDGCSAGISEVQSPCQLEDFPKQPTVLNDSDLKVKSSRSESSQAPMQRVEPPPHIYPQSHVSSTSYHDPLAGIPALPINSSNINVAFMPPPASVYYDYYNPNAANGMPVVPTQQSAASVPPDRQLSTSMHETANEAAGNSSIPPSETAGTTTSAAHQGPSDWFALPLDPFFQTSSVAVDQGLGGTGPTYGDYDMLEVLLHGHNGTTSDAPDGGNQSRPAGVEDNNTGILF
ncbi:hypothetical protein KEM54_003190 [Ascosphaera aggregata]|nr:hypothetical protein KEM54_003190 [Ascosphaera aggregata]